jgi:hypothetical protein
MLGPALISRRSEPDTSTAYERFQEVAISANRERKMDSRHDFIAIGPHGVYALCSDESDSDLVQEFIDKARKRGHCIERVPVAEAVERHFAFLRQDPCMAALIAARGLASAEE